MRSSKEKESRLSHDRLKQVLQYSASTGLFRRIEFPRGMKKSDSWISGYHIGKGYRAIQIDGRVYLCHRLAFLYMSGRWPTDDIDHINGNPSDNRFSNLREATRNDNNRWHGKPRGSSGYIGVCKVGKRYEARIKVNGEKLYLGKFDCPIAAAKERDAAARRLHGEFARLNFKE